MNGRRKYDRTFLYAITDGRGHCKIGIARNPDARRAELQTGNPYCIRVLARWEFTDERTAYGVEQCLLNKAVPKRGTWGEWIWAYNEPALIRWVSWHVARVQRGEKFVVTDLEHWNLGRGRRVAVVA